jgi:hypothetical protein
MFVCGGATLTHAAYLCCRYDYEADMRGEARVSDHSENIFRHEDPWMIKVLEGRYEHMCNASKDTVVGHLRARRGGEGRGGCEWED